MSATSSLLPIRALKEKKIILCNKQQYPAAILESENPHLRVNNFRAEELGKSLIVRGSPQHKELLSKQK
jgi:hypothetical protein